MKYLDTKENSIEDSVTRVLMGEKKLDPVNPTAVKKKLDERKDKDSLALQKRNQLQRNQLQRHDARESQLVIIQS